MAETAFKTHLGMNDILPDESPEWQALENIIRDEARKFNFEEIRTPIMEPTQLIARGVGEGTDIVTKEMFSFKRGDDDYVLRPEGTAPVARAYVQHRMQQRGGTQNLFYIGPMFRAERPQKGRQRQFHQFGAEIIGAADPIADVDVISLMLAIYNRIGITNTTLKINSVGEPGSRQKYRTALEKYFQPHLNKLSEISKQRFAKNPFRILDSKEPEDQEFIKQAPVITDFLSEASTRHYTKVKKMLDVLKIDFIEDPYLVRGLDYYTRTAFELISPDLGAQDALGGGGRYDLLIEEIGGQATPAVGFAAGMERLLIACKALGINLSKPKAVDVYVVTMGEEAVEWAVAHLSEFRNNGISCTTDYKGRSIKSQMKDANRENARFTIIVGENELNEGKFTLRDMEESTESTLEFEQMLNKLTKT